MSGSDEEGFQPHPGDPWHPGWSGDAAEEADAGPTPPDETAEVDDTAAEPSAEPKRRRFGRRRRRPESQGDEAGEVAEEEDEEEEAESPVPAAEVDAATEAPADVEVADGSDEEGIEPDPFDAVLEREGLARRVSAAEGEEDPAPAWTVEGEPSADPGLPVDQPSWIGQTTEADAGVEAIGFEPEVTEEPPEEEPETEVAIEETAPEPVEEVAAEGSDDLAAALAALAATGEVDQQGLFDEEPVDVEEAEAEPPEEEPVAEPVAELPSGDIEIAAESVVAPEEEESVVAPEEEEPAVDPAAAAEAASAEAEGSVADSPLAGEYGVAGPEAFDALQEPDVVEDAERDEWEAFMEGDAEALAPEPADVPPEVAVPEDLDEWEDEPPPKKRRRFFFRRRKAKAEEVIDDGFVGAATEPETDPAVETEGEPAESEPLPAGDAADADHTPFMPPEEGVADTDLAEKMPQPADADSDAESAVVEALEELGETDDVEIGTPVWAPAEDADTAPIDSIVADLVAEATGETPAATDGFEDAEAALADDAADEAVTEPLSGDVETPDPESIVVDLSGAAGAVGPADVLLPATEEGSASDVDEESVAEATAADQAWEDDPGRVPEGWFADVDEVDEIDEGYAEADGQDEPAEGEGAWEGRAAWEEPAPADVFDVERSDEVAVEGAEAAAPPEPEPGVPEGYEPWDDAVADAIERNESAAVAEPAPPPAPPEGFEAFPGLDEEFDISEADLAAELAEDEVWPADPIADQVTEEIDAPYVGDPEMEEQMYAAGGTVEHRGLAEAIAEAGDEDTQWQALSAAMPGVETGVVGFEDVADLGGDLGVGDDYVPPAPSTLGARVATGVVLIGLLFGSLLWHEAAFVAFLGLVVMLGLVEFYGTLRRRGFLPLSLFGLLGGVGMLVATWYHGPLAIPTVLLLTSMVTFFFYAFAPTRRDALTDGGLTILGLAWVIGTAAFAIPIARSVDFQVLVLTIVGVTAAMDIGAYSFGRTWGRSPMAPVLSPNKTIEGLAGGVVLAMIAAGAIGYLELGPFDLKAGIVLGLVVIVIAPLGDLAESLVKRSLGVKDMGSALPGHGGILDRIDALLFVIPAIWVLYETIGYLG